MTKGAHLRLAQAVGLALTLLLTVGSIAPGRPEAAAESRQGGSTIAVAEANPPADTAAAVDADWWSTVQEGIRRSEYHVTWQEGTYLADVAAAYQAPNRAHNLRTYFTPRGPVLIPRTGIEAGEAPPWRWGASLVAWGRAGAMIPVPEGVLSALENRIELGRGDGLVEGYRNDEEGVAQGFTLSGPPAGDRADEPLQFRLELAGDLIPALAESGVDVELRTAAGLDALKYGALRASDAGGSPVPAWLSLDNRALSIWVDDADAAYPIDIQLAIRGLPPTAEWAITFGTAGAEFGFSLATAGDVDGDGYSDVIIGARHYDGGLENQGAAFVYYGYPGGLYEFADWLKVGDQAGAHYGWSVATAGDVNGDGFTDVIVGAPGYANGQTEEGRIWIYHGASGGLSESAARHKESNVADAEFGSSVATAGDVNGDGYADIIVGAEYYSASHVAEGRAYVWHGGPEGIPTGDAAWIAESNQTGGVLGSAVATAGDVDADGYADVIVGASGYDDTYVNQGAVFVWHGSATGVNGGASGNPSNASWTFLRAQQEARLGISVSTAGDVNGDGYADIIVGAHLYNHTLADEGAAWLFLGSETGLESDWDNFDYGNQAGAWFGYSVATAGDVNGDGYADVIVGAPLFTTTTLEEGRAWVWHGSADGISTYRDWYADGEMSQAWYGNCVATAGDVNGDGYSDVIVGAPGHAAEAGRAYVYSGGPDTLAETAGWTKPSNQAGALYGTSVGTAGDVNGDGYADVIVGAPHWDGGVAFEGAAWVYLGQATGLASGPHFYKRSNNAGAEFGASVGTAGDVNGDGYDDIIVGAPGWNVPEVNEGGAFVYPGSADGLNQNAGPLWSKDSDQAGARFGSSVGTAGDVNGDGYMDIVVGAPFWQSGGEERGSVWLYYGSDSGPHNAPDWYTPGDQAAAQYGFAVGTAGDVNGDGYSDVLVGSPLWEDDVVSEGRAWAYLGSRSGLRHDIHWHAEANNYNAQMGHALATAGDVDGDGYSDVIVGAPSFGDGGLEGEGKAWVFHGSADGLERAATWSREGGQDSVHYGWSVGTAGDVNGDGYADVIIGIENWSGGQLYEGAASVYHGSWRGLEETWSWRQEGNDPSAHYGTSVGTAGDVNGDGYADVIVGAPNYETSSELLDEGLAFLYYGNGGPGVSLIPRQSQLGRDTPIARLGIAWWWESISMPGLRLHLLQSSPFGRGGMEPEAEIEPLGTPLDGTRLYRMHSYGNLAPGSEAVLDILLPMYTGVPAHWRIRDCYDPATTPWMPCSRWLTMPWNGWNEQDFRAGGYRVLLPLVLREYP
ncbi:MAG: FG-GAP-like repeat-containing protein [Anaerolineae bacterium]